MMIPILGTLLFSIVLCRAYLHVATARQIVDVPNARSSHSTATPSGGGISLMIAFVLGLGFSAATGLDWGFELLGLVALACVLAALGFLDDLRGIPVGPRFLAYSLASLLLSWFLLQPMLDDGSAAVIAMVGIVALIILWSLNLYNFMDGIDGIAALQAVLACLGAAVLSWRQVGESEYLFFCLLLAASHAGFLCWNFPPARLFMGDAGSVPTGFIIAGLAVLGWQQGVLNPLCWIVLLAVFITDASWTLGRRVINGERFTQGHRSHAYQRLSRHWSSHLKVDVLLLAINLLWLLPLAFAVQQWPAYALIMVILAYLPLWFGMAKIGGMT